MNEETVQHPELSMDAKHRLVPEILTRLDKVYGERFWQPSGKPVDGLVGTILSQNTSDTNTDRAFRSLRERFPEWHQVAAAPVKDIIEAIRPGGLAQQKAPRIQRALADLVDSEASDPNQKLLSTLEAMSAEDGMKWLTSMNGVGPKTAACVLLFDIGKTVVPVDTHVFRVSKRIGLISPGCTADRAHQELLEIVPGNDAYRFHVHFIEHGRAICKARTPLCHECVLEDLCLYGIRQKQQRDGDHDVTTQGGSG